MERGQFSKDAGFRIILMISNSQSWQPCLALFISMEGSIGFCGDALVKASCENERIIEGF